MVQFAIDSLSHFDKHSSHQHQNLKRLVCGRESNDMVTHVLWCSLLLQRVGMRHPFPIVPRFVPCRIIAKKKHIPVCGLGHPHAQHHSGQVFFGEKQASGNVNEHFEVFVHQWPQPHVDRRLDAHDAPRTLEARRRTGSRGFLATFCGA